VQLRDGRHEAEAEAAAGSVAALLGAIEAPEHGLVPSDRNAGPRVGHGEAAAPVLLKDA
jgi:hypothetical protein